MRIFCFCFLSFLVWLTRMFSHCACIYKCHTNEWLVLCHENILAFNKCCEIKTVVWCMCCQSKNAVVLCETSYWSKPLKVTVLDLRAISKAQISTHLKCMGISNGKNMIFNNEFIVNICRVWNSVYSRKCRILIMLR